MIAPHALDAALERIAADASRIDITTAKPKTYADVMKSSIGYTQTFKVTKPTDCAGGRSCDVTNIGEGTTTGQGMPAYWAITGKGQLLACGTVPNGKKIIAGLPFRLPPLCCELMMEL